MDKPGFKIPVWRPMLAPNTPVKPIDVALPTMASYKIDGIRATIINGQPISRSGKLIPNLFVQRYFADHHADGLDGELVVGIPNDFDETYRRSFSGIMSIKGEPDFTFWVFDQPFVDGLFLNRRPLREFGRIKVIPQVWITQTQQLTSMEDLAVSTGYEGLIVKDPNGPYKNNRCTLKQAWMLKIKQYLDSEAEILYCYERMHNTNAAKTNELGYTTRSSHKEGLVSTGILGGFHVRDIHHREWEFDIGTLRGLPIDGRTHIWQHKDEYVGKIVKYKYFPVGMKDVPRHPAFLGFRSKEDMS